jgi:CDP-glucose 4,6-dehydratase
LTPDFNRFNGTRVLVTGDTGFKGSWLAMWLHGLGAEVTGFALPPDGTRALFDALGLNGLIHHVDGDIRELPALRRVVDACRPQVVFHMAAQSLVRRSYADPKTTFDTNVAGSVNVLEALRDAPDIRSIVYVTSDKCYRNREWAWGYRESDELGGRDPYSASKAAAELVFSAYQESFFSKRPELGAATVRAGNVIGGGDWAEDRLVPDCIRALEAGQPIVLRSPEATRPWQHVLEPLSGYMMLALNMLAEPKQYSGAWNFGPEPGAVTSVRQVTEQMVRLWGDGEIRCIAKDSDPHEAHSLQVSIDKARQFLAWQPRWGVERTLSETVAWYKSVGAGGSAAEMTRAQIAAYASMD